MNQPLRRTCRTCRTCRATLATLLLLCGVARAAGLTAYTEEWPPYNYSEGSTLKGIATDVLHAACTEARIECRIAVVPWARAYSTVLNTPNTLIYTIARNAAREQDFVWLGPLLPRAVWVYGRPERTAQIHELKDLARLRIGIVRNDASGADLLAAGVPASALVADSSNASVLRMYRRRMIDALVDTEVGMAWRLRDASMPADSVTRLLRLSDDGAYYYAFNRDSDPQLVRALQRALDNIRHDGTLEAIKRKYLEHGD